LLAGRKLLLADDSITIQKVVDLTFSDEGYRVLCVSNGRDAIERLEEFAPDVVLADVFMPHMNGYEVCEYIKQNQRLKHIPVMLLVGSFEPFDEAFAR
jgi:CheY-like chemotaxis protein